MTCDTQLIQRILDLLPNRSSTDSAQLAAAIRPLTKTRDGLVREIIQSSNAVTQVTHIRVIVANTLERLKGS